MKGNISSSSRSIDIRESLIKTFDDKIKFAKPSGSSFINISEYVLPSYIDFLPNVVNLLAAENDIQNSLMLKSITCTISEEIKSRPLTLWPPTPQQIIDSEDNVSIKLYNLLALIVSPNSSIDHTGTVRLSEVKATKVDNICQDIETLFPSIKPSLPQLFLTLNMYRKTGSSFVINDPHQLGHGISYTETQFIGRME